MLSIKRQDDVSVLEFSVRVQHCLRKAGITTIGELLDYPQGRLMEIRNIGGKGCEEIQSKLQSILTGDGEYHLVDTMSNRVFPMFDDDDAIELEQPEEEWEDCYHFLAVKNCAKAKDSRIGICFDADFAWLFGPNRPGNQDDIFSVAVIKDTLETMGIDEFWAAYGHYKFRFIQCNLFTGKEITSTEHIRYGDAKKSALAIDPMIDSCAENASYWIFYNNKKHIQDTSLTVSKNTGNVGYYSQILQDEACGYSQIDHIDYLTGKNFLSNNAATEQVEYVQSFIDNISFPTTLEGLLSEVYDHQGAFSIEEFEMCDYTEWTAPKWCKIGDIVFFMHGKSVLAKIKHLEHLYKLCGDEYTGEEREVIENRLQRARQLYQKYGGKIFAIGKVKSGAFHWRNSDKNAHWKSNVYAPIDDIYLLENPIQRAEFSDFITVSSASALTAVFGDEFTRLKEIILSKNSVPEYFRNSVAVPVPLSKINDENWLDVCNNYRHHFFMEIQFRTFYVDRFLKVLGDRKRFFEECPCYKKIKKPSYVDNVILLGGKYLPVECKLSLPSEVDIKGQVHKYCKLKRMVLDSKTGKEADLEKIYTSQVLIIDTEKIYIFDDDEYEVEELISLDHICCEDDIVALRERLLQILK